MYNCGCTVYLVELGILVVLSIVVIFVAALYIVIALYNVVALYVLRLLLCDLYSRGLFVLLSRWRTQSDRSESAEVYSCTVNQILFLLSTNSNNLREINGTFFFFYRTFLWNKQ